MSAATQLRLRIVPEYPGLVVSEDGQIQGPSGKWLHPFPSKTNPYLHFNTYRDGRWAQHPVHVVVCVAFHGSRPGGMLVRHLDGDHRNNRAGNLAWGTSQDNEADKKRHGRDLRGERHPQAKLSENDVLEIRRLNSAGVSGRSLASQYEVSESQVSSIVLRKSWRHL